MDKNKQVMRDHFNERVNGTQNICKNPPLPHSLNIEVNNTCNHLCVFCPYHGIYAPEKIEPGILDIDFVKSLLEQAHSLGIGKKEVGFYIAGEPLLYNGLLEVTAYAKKLGFPYVFMTTNGALATPDKMKALLDAGIDSVRFSINAADRSKYAEVHGKDDFNAVVENVKYMHEYIVNNQLDVATSITCVLTKQTEGIQSEMHALFDQYVDDIAFIPVMLYRLSNLEKVREKFELIKEDELTIDKDYICPLLFNTMYINAYGKVIPCCSSYDDGTFFADLKKNPSLSDAWNSEGYQHYRSIFLEGQSDHGTICEKCMIRMKSTKGIFYEK